MDERSLARRTSRAALGPDGSEPSARRDRRVHEAVAVAIVLTMAEGSACFETKSGLQTEAGSPVDGGAPFVAALTARASDGSTALPQAVASAAAPSIRGACRVTAGPIELPRMSPPCLDPKGDEVVVVLNGNGHPRFLPFAAGAQSSMPLRSGGAPDEGGKRTSLPCACAGDVVYCPSGDGAVYRTRGASSAADLVVAASRPGSRVQAVTFAGSHVALGYLANKKTTEGWVTEAWLSVDDGAPIRLSDEGSGATAIALAPRGDGALALTVDARAALSALHAREIVYGGQVRLGEDTVVFVGGPVDGHTRPAIVAGAGLEGWAFLPLAKDIATFGVVGVRLEAPPKTDEPFVWSLYPDGLDPACVAAVETSSGTWLARARPERKGLDSPHLIEVGRWTPDGFSAAVAIPTRGVPRELTLAVDFKGALWIGWMDPYGSSLERLGCH
jgi:hypothetical protein